MKEMINLGTWTKEDLDGLLKESASMLDVGARIDHLSAQFLGVGYRESTLIGDVNTPETFVINLEGLDCFTFIDYIEAMRISGTFKEFKKKLKKVRYRCGKISYECRNHFFTDWLSYREDLIENITERISSGKSKKVRKTLNRKDDGTCFLSGIACAERTITYISAESIDAKVVDNLKTGDYIGIYSDMQGLDVSHVGILIRDRDTVIFRHASSSEKYRKVVDEDFRNYVKNKPGIVVLRPKEFLYLVLPESV